MEERQTRHWFSPILILVLSIIGVVITEVSVETSIYYWMGIFVFLAILFTFLALKSDGKVYVMHHAGHWIGGFTALVMVYLFMDAGRLDPSQGALVSFLILALTVFTDGLRLHYRYAVVGFYLFVAVGIIAFVEAFVWWFLVLSLVVIGLEVALIMQAKKDKTTS
ncbi:hypothetical protein A3715_07735 [Oleiphilus sp. HI0009]|nr:MULTISPECIES: hypothetical protein [unclassified Oleiphilus]KZX78776.1 hypothetical protein A3715_09795 [Oleiphilus sp. HI0009]KZX80748.1 hypothetical protein A3715_07735 [Oleiphilus sp. HI0009]KZY62406.1 hypothetical protein A3738_12870 [Oleiphilus sp. HI0066]KZY70461.1 hypothetical protein A3739_06825 [Oleiphilus sp. HI0067]KZZ55239.1 hypothetical protein A3762_12155 [Oleiphilus sp. HI0125]